MLKGELHYLSEWRKEGNISQRGEKYVEKEIADRKNIENKNGNCGRGRIMTD